MKHKKRNIILTCIAGFILLTIVTAATGSNNTPTVATVAAAQPIPVNPAPAAVTQPDAGASASGACGYTCPSPDSEASAPKPKPRPKPKPPKPQPTASQRNALESAQEYLSDGQGFSREGLIQQLSSSAGEGFDMADSVWAVDHAGADWDLQAITSAQSYMSDGEGFSRSGLLDQLTSSAGEGFTYAQAAQAVAVVYH